MRTKDLIDLADNPDFISGIYNYCDRWCERCPFASRCLVYAMEAEDEDDPASRDIHNAAFWRNLQSILEQSREMIASWAEEQGIDLSFAAPQPVRAGDDVEKHELSVAAKGYAFSIDEWFKEDLIELPGADYRTAADPETDTAEMVSDATDVIRWYQYLIATKTVRGLMARDDQEDEDLENVPNSSDGSIKVALIAIDRSISAWRIMQMVRTDRADSVNPQLVALERLRLNLEKSFPHARDFIRPGFDENPDRPVN